MAKFFYKHFGDDVPLYIEREYNRLLIQEHNQEIREHRNRVQSLNFDEVSEFVPDPSTIPVSEHELEKHSLDADRLDYLPIALKLLEIEHPDLYEIVKEYFFSADKVTLAALARKHNVSVDSIRYKINLAKKQLKLYYDKHEKNDNFVHNAEILIFLQKSPKNLSRKGKFFIRYIEGLFHSHGFPLISLQCKGEYTGLRTVQFFYPFSRCAVPYKP